MADKSITERQQFWLAHLKAAEAAGISLVQYAEAHELKVKDLYQWKTTLTKRGFWAPSASSFVTVKAKSSSATCSMVLPNVFDWNFKGRCLLI